MSLYVASLNSGSNGNCYYLGNQDEAVLIDAGVSCREIEKRMKRLDLSIKKVKAVFISHEHGDHIHGVPTLSRKYNLPVYITTSTLRNGNLRLNREHTVPFSAYHPVCIGNLSITAFPKFHDASDPHSFIITHHDVNVGVFTDIGVACRHVKKYFEQCHAAFLESNYDELMLENGRYPLALKNRIRNGKGHLSNTQAAELFLHHRPPFMSHLFLSHLSRNNNSPKIVHELFSRIAGRTEIVIASRDKETEVYHITNTTGQTQPVIHPAPSSGAQLSLF